MTKRYDNTTSINNILHDAKDSEIKRLDNIIKEISKFANTYFDGYHRGIFEDKMNELKGE